MVIALGCDIVEHATTKRLQWDTKVSVQKRVFSNAELSICPTDKTIEFLSGRFAAKESVLKCLGTGMQDGIALTDISILQQPGGKPSVRLQGGAKSRAEELKINTWHVTITHSSKYSISTVIAEFV